MRCAKKVPRHQCPSYHFRFLTFHSVTGRTCREPVSVEWIEDRLLPTKDLYTLGLCETTVGKRNRNK